MDGFLGESATVCVQLSRVCGAYATACAVVWHCRVKHATGDGTLLVC